MSKNDDKTPTPETIEPKRKGLPGPGEAWNPGKHDPVVMGRISRAFDGVPASALSRLRPWTLDLIEHRIREEMEAQQEAKLAAVRQGNASLSLSQHNPQAAMSGQWDAATRSFKQGA